MDAPIVRCSCIKPGRLVPVRKSAIDHLAIGHLWMNGCKLKTLQEDTCAEKNSYPVD